MAIVLQQGMEFVGFRTRGTHECRNQVSTAGDIACFARAVHEVIETVTHDIGHPESPIPRLRRHDQLVQPNGIVRHA